MADIENHAEINALRQLLKQTDYKVIKFAEGQLTEDEFGEIKEKRQRWRSFINELQSKNNRQ